MKKLKNSIKLFLIMFKIGLFTFGGGYAMLALLENEFVENKKWLTKEELDSVEWLPADITLIDKVRKCM